MEGARKGQGAGSRHPRRAARRKKSEALIDAAAAMRAYAVNPRFDMVDAAFCTMAHARGLKVLVWTVDAPEAMRILIAAGVDGIMTNYPARLRE